MELTITVADIAQHPQGPPADDGWKKLSNKIAGDPSTPLLVSTILETSGMDDTLWVVENIIDPYICRLFAADCAEIVLPLFEATHPEDDRPRKAIAVARDERATAEELRAAAHEAKQAATQAATREGSAHSAAANAAWAAHGTCLSTNQTMHSTCAAHVSSRAIGAVADGVRAAQAAALLSWEGSSLEDAASGAKVVVAEARKALTAAKHTAYAAAQTKAATNSACAEASSKMKDAARNVAWAAARMDKAAAKALLRADEAVEKAVKADHAFTTFKAAMSAAVNEEVERTTTVDDVWAARDAAQDAQRKRLMQYLNNGRAAKDMPWD